MISVGLPTTPTGNPRRSCCPRWPISRAGAPDRPRRRRRGRGHRLGGLQVLRPPPVGRLAGAARARSRGRRHRPPGTPRRRRSGRHHVHADDEPLCRGSATPQTCAASRRPRPTTTDGVVLVVGDEDFLVGRAIEQIAAAGRRADPDGRGGRTRRRGGDPGRAVTSCLSPSLFGERPHRRRAVGAGRPGGRGAGAHRLLRRPGRRHHPGHPARRRGAGGDLLDAARAAASAVITCAKLTRPAEREDFVRAEMRRHRATDHLRRRCAPDRCGRHRSAGAGWRCAQLASDSGGRVDADVVAAYHRGKAQVSGFVVADHAVVGDVAGAMENLRWALSIGVAPVLIADALADGVRSIAKVSGAGRGSPNVLASRLGMPPWKVQRVQRQAAGWTRAGAGPGDDGRRGPQRRRQGRGRRPRVRAGTAVDAAEPAPSALTAVDRGCAAAGQLTGESRDATPGHRGPGREAGRAVRALDAREDSEGVGALGQGRLLVRGLVRVDDALAGGLVQRREASTQQDGAPGPCRRRRRPRGSDGPRS